MARRNQVTHVNLDAFECLERAACGRGVQPDELADELLAAARARASSDLEIILADLAGGRSRVCGSVDAVALVREGRKELERRGH